MEIRDAILYWNNVCQQAHANDHTGEPNNQEQGGPAFASRAFAIVHAAMYDAANSFYRTRAPYIKSNSGTVVKIRSVESAISGAAFTTLFHLYQKQKAYLQLRLSEYQSLFQEDLIKVNPEDFKIGERIALRIIEVRASDRSDESRMRSPKALFPNGSEEVVLNRPNPGPDDPYITVPPGVHQPDPENPNQGRYAPRWGVVTPFVIANLTSVIQSKDFPLLTSDAYRSDFEEAKRVGSLKSTDRKAHELETGIYWAYDGTQKIGTPIRLYNQIAQNVSKTFSFSQEENARYFLLINLAMADAGIHTWFAKYKHNLWRPVVAINYHPNRLEPPNWRPFGSPNSNLAGAKNFTPPFPAYPSGHATFGSALFTIIRMFLAEQFERQPTQSKMDLLPIKKMVSDEYNGVTIDNMTGRPRLRLERTLSIDEAIKQNLESRIFLGVHWRFDGVEGDRVGKEIGKRTFLQIATQA